MASTLTYQAIRKTFAGQAAIESFDLAMEPGELVSLLGPSGCGKTTALRIAAGFEQPDSGAILVDDRNVVGTPPHRRNMGMVFQSYSLFPNLDVSAQRRLRLAGASGVQDRAAAPRRRGARTRHTSPTSPTATPTNFPVASNSAWRWPERSCSSRPCYCSTNHCRHSTPRCASTSARRSAVCNCSSG